MLHQINIDPLQMFLPQSHAEGSIVAEFLRGPVFHKAYLQLAVFW